MDRLDYIKQQNENPATKEKCDGFFKNECWECFHKKDCFFKRDADLVFLISQCKK